MENFHTYHKWFSSDIFTGNNTRNWQWKYKHQSSPGTSSHLHTGVKSRLTLKVVHDDTVITVDDMLVDALPTEMLKDFVNAVDAVQNGLEVRKRKKEAQFNLNT